MDGSLVLLHILLVALFQLLAAFFTEWHKLEPCSLLRFSGTVKWILSLYFFHSNRRFVEPVFFVLCRSRFQQLLDKRLGHNQVISRICAGGTLTVPGVTPELPTNSLPHQTNEEILTAFDQFEQLSNEIADFSSSSLIHEWNSHVFCMCILSGDRCALFDHETEIQ